MLLKNCEIVLGTVLSNNDPEKLGRIKCGAPGYFSRAKGKMSVTDIPWVYPFTMAANQSFSVPEEGKKVWLLDNKEVDEEFWYIPFHEMSTSLKDASGAYEGTDIMFSREIGGKMMRMYSTLDSGVKLEMGDSKIDLNANGDIVIKTAEQQLKISGGECIIGSIDSEGEKEPVVLGNKYKEFLSSLSEKFVELATLSSNPYALPSLAPVFSSISTDIIEKQLNDEPNMFSDTVFVTS